MTPVIDFAVQQSCVDPKRIALVGNSFGGYLALRAAAFEHRLAAIVLCDGVWSFGDALTQYIPPESLKAINDGHHEQFDKGFTEKMNAPDTPVSMKWGFQQGEWQLHAIRRNKMLMKVRYVVILRDFPSSSCSKDSEVYNGRVGRQGSVSGTGFRR